MKLEEVPDSYAVVQTPRCLQDISSRAKSRRYTSVQMYMETSTCWSLMQRCTIGYKHEIASEARQLREEGLRMLRGKELL